MFRSVLIRPRQEFGSPDHLFRLLGLHACAQNSLMLFDVPVVAIIVDGAAIVWEPTLYLAYQSLASHSATGDGVRTYSEALLPWLRFLKGRNCGIQDATEMLLKIYRNELSRKAPMSPSRGFSSATIALRIKVVQFFHEWGEKRRAFQSPLGRWLAAASCEKGSSQAISFRRSAGIAPTVVTRVPRSLAPEACKRLISSLPNPYRLAFKWSVCTGIRRFEICALTVDQIITARDSLRGKEAMGVVKIIRKGGRELDIHVPSRLLNETWWYITTERPVTAPCETKLFVRANGKPTTRRMLTDTYRIAAKKNGIPSTLHHLRHTFAVTVFHHLSVKALSGEQINPLKTLQVLLGHASVKTSEVYLRSLDVQSDSVRQVLDYLDGEPP